MEYVANVKFQFSNRPRLLTTGKCFGGAAGFKAADA
jgi:hypothetical protein